MKRVFALVLLLLPALAQPVARELKATVVGDGVGWETHAFRIWLVIPEKGRVRLDLFSPGFDPTDYRSALLGKPELGDERYDGGRGSLRPPSASIGTGSPSGRWPSGWSPTAGSPSLKGRWRRASTSLKASFSETAKTPSSSAWRPRASSCLWTPSPSSSWTSSPRPPPSAFCRTSGAGSGWSPLASTPKAPWRWPSTTRTAPRSFAPGCATRTAPWKSAPSPGTGGGPPTPSARASPSSASPSPPRPGSTPTPWPSGWGPAPLWKTGC